MVGKPELTRPRSFVFQLRALRAEIESWAAAAKAAGQSTSAWCRERLNEAAGRVNVPRTRRSRDIVVSDTDRAFAKRIAREIGVPIPKDEE